MLARGIDIITIALVVNYDIPIEGPKPHTKVSPISYVHRTGRGGRFGRKCLAVTLFDQKGEHDQFKQI